MNAVEIAMLTLLAANLVACVVLLIRKPDGSVALSEKLDVIVGRQSETTAGIQSALASLREEAASSAKLGREELSSRLDGVGANLSTIVTNIGNAQNERFDGFGKQLGDMRTVGETQGKELRGELIGNFDKLVSSLSDRVRDQSNDQTKRLDSFASRLNEHRQGSADDAKALREEVQKTLSTLGNRLIENAQTIGKQQAEALAAVTTSVKDLGKAVEERLEAIRTDNDKKLEQMRVTVDEKLQSTLEARLGASFNQVNENLERVFKSVGEMQTIATGVGDLKRVLTNVKARGTWGEGNLALMLEQVFTPEQYSANVEIQPNSGQRVEFAIRMPGDGEDPLWLPIDAKLPIEDYERLINASEAADVLGVEEASKALERTVRKCAADISRKYICPPHSMDFAIMFLPTEGLFAEVVRRPGLSDNLRREHRVIIVGPTTLMATLESLRMGFRSLAIQQRSSEVWQVLGAVKTEFGKFGDVLDKVHKKLGEAQNVVEQAGTRRRAVDRKLRDVEALPEAASQTVLAITADDAILEEIEEIAGDA